MPFTRSGLKPVDSRSKSVTKPKILNDVNNENIPPSKIPTVKKRKPLNKARPAPNFNKLHKKWEHKFESGKACTKKPLTLCDEFDLSKSCQKIAQVTHRTENEFPALSQPDFDQDLEFASDQVGLDEVVGSSGNGSRTRRPIFAELPITSVGGHNSNHGDEAQFQSLAAQQEEDGLDFEINNDALDSILTNKGVSEVSSTVAPSNYRQTTFKTPSSTQTMIRPSTTMRRSIYYTGPADKSKSAVNVLADQLVKRWTMDSRGVKQSTTAAKSAVKTSMKPPVSPSINTFGGVYRVPQRHSIYAKYERRPNRVQSNKSPSVTPRKAKAPEQIRDPPKTPYGAAQRVVRTVKASPAQSPAVRTPIKPVSIGKALRWADVLEVEGRLPPSAQPQNTKDNVAMELFASDDTVYQTPSMPPQLQPGFDSSPSVASTVTMETTSPSDCPTLEPQTAQQLKDMEEIEKMLEKEIEEMERKAQSEKALLTPPQLTVPSTTPTVPGTTPTVPLTSLISPSALGVQYACDPLDIEDMLPSAQKYSDFVSTSSQSLHEGGTQQDNNFSPLSEPQTFNDVFESPAFSVNNRLGGSVHLEHTPQNVQATFIGQTYNYSTTGDNRNVNQQLVDQTKVQASNSTSLGGELRNHNAARMETFHGHYPRLLTSIPTHESSDFSGLHTEVLKSTEDFHDNSPESLHDLESHNLDVTDIHLHETMSDLNQSICDTQRQFDSLSKEACRLQKRDGHGNAVMTQLKTIQTQQNDLTKMLVSLQNQLAEQQMQLLRHGIGQQADQSGHQKDGDSSQIPEVKHGPVLSAIQQQMIQLNGQIASIATGSQETPVGKQWDNREAHHDYGNGIFTQSHIDERVQADVSPALPACQLSATLAPAVTPIGGNGQQFNVNNLTTVVTPAEQPLQYATGLNLAKDRKIGDTTVPRVVKPTPQKRPSPLETHLKLSATVDKVSPPILTPLALESASTEKRFSFWPVESPEIPEGNLEHMTPRKTGMNRLSFSTGDGKSVLHHFLTNRNTGSHEETSTGGQSRVIGAPASHVSANLVTNELHLMDNLKEMSLSSSPGSGISAAISSTDTASSRRILNFSECDEDTQPKVLASRSHTTSEGIGSLHDVEETRLKVLVESEQTIPKQLWESRGVGVGSLNSSQPKTSISVKNNSSTHTTNASNCAVSAIISDYNFFAKSSTSTLYSAQSSNIAGSAIGEDSPSLSSEEPEVSLCSQQPASITTVTATTASTAASPAVVGSAKPVMKNIPLSIALARARFANEIKMSATQRFYDVLVDEECALYACRVPTKYSPQPPVSRCFTNPVATVLTEGDETHFIPIREEHSSPRQSQGGSAFNCYGAY